MSVYESEIFHGVINKSAEKSQKPEERFQKAICGYRYAEFQNQLLELHPNIRTVDKLLFHSTNYLESQCTSKYGFLNEVSQQIDMSNSVLAIPSIFDSALIIELMDYAGIALSSAVIETVRQILLNSRNDSGLWSFFIKEFMILHSDIDTSSVSTSALLSCGVDKKVIADIAENIFRNVTYHKDNLVNVYYTNLLDTNKNAEEILDQRPNVRRVCLSCTANFLYLQNRMGNKDLEKLNASYELLNQGIEAVGQDDQKFLGVYAKYYSNLDLVCFFISRLKSVAQHPEKIKWEKLAEVVMKRLEPNEIYLDVVTLASQILAGLALGVNDVATGRKLLLQAIQNLINLREGDGSFPKYGIYNGSKQFHFGSTAISTAFAVAAMKMAKEKIPELEIEIKISKI